MSGKTAKAQDAEQAAPEDEARDPLEDVLKGVAESFSDKDGAPANGAEDASPEEQADLQKDSPLDPVSAEAEAEAAEIDLLTARIDELEAENAAIKDRLLRAMADAENTRRRAERDKADALAFGGSKLARDLLPVLDNLDRALKSADDDLRAAAKDFIEGVELTKREVLAAFAKHKIETVEPALGDKFDPNLHQAMFEAPAPGAKAGTVIEIMQTGFTIAGRLLRPALVGVAKAMAEPAKDAAKGPAKAAEKS